MRIFLAMHPPRFRLAIALAWCLASCSASASTAAEQEAKLIEKSGGNPADLCPAWEKVRDAYLAEQNQPKYRHAKLVAEGWCSRST